MSCLAYKKADYHEQFSKYCVKHFTRELKNGVVSSLTSLRGICVFLKEVKPALSTWSKYRLIFGCQ